MHVNASFYFNTNKIYLVPYFGMKSDFWFPDWICLVSYFTTSSNFGVSGLGVEWSVGEERCSIPFLSKLIFQFMSWAKVKKEAIRNSILSWINKILLELTGKVLERLRELQNSIELQWRNGGYISRFIFLLFLWKILSWLLQVMGYMERTNLVNFPFLRPHTVWPGERREEEKVGNVHIRKERNNKLDAM
jgi:hypothetical protein